jgi:hypothetical protein
MSYLAQAKKPSPQPPVLTIVGFPGVGKSTLGALFPAPIFIQAENAGTAFEQWDADLQPSLMPEIPSPSAARGIRSSEVLLEQLRELHAADHGYQTVVIDAITTVNALFEQEIIAFSDGSASNISDAEGGYGKGYLAVAGLHAKIRHACEYLRRRGIGVVFLAHTGLAKVKNRPDVEAYSTWSIDMHEASRRVYVATSDAVLYLHSREYVTGGEVDRKGRQTKLGKIRSTGERILITASDGIVGFVDAKNRYHMPAEIEVHEGTNPITQYIPYYTNTNTESNDNE